MRCTSAAESQTGQLAGLPSGTTFNGYFAALVAGASQDFKIRHIQLGVRQNTAAVPTSQQYTVKVFRQTVRVVGTGFTTFTPQNKNQRGAATQITGLDTTTAATAGTTGPTLAANAIGPLITANTQQFTDVPAEFLDELDCDQGTANGLAFVNIGAALPSGHLFVLMVEHEE